MTQASRIFIERESACTACCRSMRFHTKLTAICFLLVLGFGMVGGIEGAPAELDKSAQRLSTEYPQLAVETLLNPQKTLPQVEKSLEQERAGKARPERLSQLLRIRGYIALRAENLEQAMKDHLEALELAREHGLNEEQVLNLNMLGGIFWNLDRYDQALQILEHLVDLADEYGDTASMAIAYGNIGLLLIELGELERARESLGRAGELSRHNPQVSSQGAIQVNMGELELKRGKTREAVQHFTRALSLQRDSGQPSLIADAHNGLASALLASGDFEAARIHAQAATDLCEANSHPKGARAAYNLLAQALAEIGDYAAAYAAMAKASAAQAQFIERVQAVQMDSAFASIQQAMSDPSAAPADEGWHPFPAMGWTLAVGVIGLVGMAAAFYLGRRWRLLPEIEPLQEPLIPSVRHSGEASAYLSLFRHDYRSLLNALGGMIALMQDIVHDPQQRRYLATLASSSDAVLERFNELCEFQEIENGHFEPGSADVELREFVQTIVEKMQPQMERNQVRLELRIDPAVPQMMRVDARRWQLCFERIFSNRIRHAEGCRVEWSIRPSLFARGGSLMLRSEWIVDTTEAASSGSMDTNGNTSAELYLVNRVARLLGGSFQVNRIAHPAAVRLELPATALQETQGSRETAPPRHLLLVGLDEFVAGVIEQVAVPLSYEVQLLGTSLDVRQNLQNGSVQPIIFCTKEWWLAHFKEVYNDTEAASAWVPSEWVLLLPPQDSQIPAVASECNQRFQFLRRPIVRKDLVELLSARASSAKRQSSPRTVTENGLTR